MKTERQEIYGEMLKEFDKRVDKCTLTYEDALELSAYAHRMYFLVDDLKKSRDKWKEKYQELKNLKVSKDE